MSNGKVFKHTLKYDGRVKIDKTLFRTDCVEHRARESRRVSESLIKTWVDTQNDDNSRYYIPINSPPHRRHPFKNHSKCVIYHVLSIDFGIILIFFASGASFVRGSSKNCFGTKSVQFRKFSETF